MSRVDRLSRFGVAVACMLAVLGARQGRAETSIVKDGQPNAEIVIAKDPPRIPSERRRTFGTG